MTFIKIPTLLFPDLKQGGILNLNTPDGFLGVIFGFLGKFRIDIAKNIFEKYKHHYFLLDDIKVSKNNDKLKWYISIFQKIE